jgi:DNA replication and repair protein RecF
MPLRRLRVADFRCLQTAELEFDPSFTLITGPNASGKTSLLEAVYLLSRGRSFRTSRVENLIRSGAAQFVVFGEVETALGANRAAHRVGLGVEGSSEGLRARMAGERVASLSELSAVLPVQIIDPEVHRLIEEGPSRRRRFIDWGVFHVEHSYVAMWQRYQRALRQRNAGLKARQARAVVSAWDSELVKLGQGIDAARADYVSRLSAVATPVVLRLLDKELVLNYRSGWAKDTTLEAALEAAWSHDLEAGSTSVGPQRAELVIRLDGSVVKDRISRGQQKLLAAALLVAQLRLFDRQSAVQPSLLLDDPAAELDSDKLMSLMTEVSRDSVQLVATSLSADFKALGEPGRRYRVDEGRFTLRD